MSRRVTYYEAGSPPTIAEIFGANYYDDWDAKNITGVADGNSLSSWQSVGTNGGLFSAPSGDEPTYKTSFHSYNDPVVQFNGVNEFMTVNNSTAMYNFLHNGKGIIITVRRCLPHTSIPITNVNNTNYTGFVQIQSNSGDATNRCYAGINGSFAYENSISGVFPSGTNTPQVKTLVEIHDPNNSTAADRVTNIYDGGSQIKNNTVTNPPDTGDASFDLRISGRPVDNDLFLKGQVMRMVIIDRLPTNYELTLMNKRLIYDYGQTPYAI